MPHPNRVRPDGGLGADATRGTFFGNRGVLHDDDGRIVRDWQVRRWLICRLRWRGRRRRLLQPRRYTELFFLDEATALAAGHRPCAQCRHAEYTTYRDAWRDAHPGEDASADAIDRVLHTERTGPRSVRASCDGLPDGTMVAHDGQWWSIDTGRLHPWRPDGYGPPVPVEGVGPVEVLTPASTVAVLGRGYRPVLHGPSVVPA